MRLFFIFVSLFLGLMYPSSTFASHVELDECIEIAHCVREEWEVNSLKEPFEEIKEIIKNTPRSVIVQLEGDYLHAEVTTKWMKYVDDLEVSFAPESNKLVIRSESRVGESDLGVNQKRVDLLKSKLL